MRLQSPTFTNRFSYADDSDTTNPNTQIFLLKEQWKMGYSISNSKIDNPHLPIFRICNQHVMFIMGKMLLLYIFVPRNNVHEQ